MQAMEEELEMLRSGVAVLLHRITPVPGANAQLRRFCADDVFWWLRGPLRATTRVRGHPRVGESRKWASHALCGAFLASFRVRGTPQSAWHAPEDLSRASERIRRISRQMCRNRLLPVVVWAGSLVMALSGGAWAQIHSKPPFPYRRRSFDLQPGRRAVWSTNTQSEPATARSSATTDASKATASSSRICTSAVGSRSGRASLVRLLHPEGHRSL